MNLVKYLLDRYAAWQHGNIAILLTATCFKKLNFEFIVIDFSMFINNIIIVVIYINEILFINLDKVDMQTIINKFHKKFKIIDLSLYIYYFDLTIIKNRINRILRFE